MGVFYRSFAINDKSEIWSPGLFSDHHPLTGGPPVVQEWEDAVANNANILPITSLSHITHNEQAAAIKGNDDGNFVFKPKAKFGKRMYQREGSYVGGTFKKTYNPDTRQDEFTRILHNVPVFPGQISWWGISRTDCHETGTIDDFQERLVESKGNNSNLVEAHYLVPESRYGNQEFIVSLSDLMTIYKQSRTDCTDKKVCLQNAGTLRYKYEICYIIMVAMEHDSVERDFPSIYSEPIFQHKGLIDNNGKLSDSSITPDFKIKHPFTYSRNSEIPYWDNYSWETLAFALYFPDDPQMVLECPTKYCREKEIKHCSPCLSKQQNHQGDWVCPN